MKRTCTILKTIIFSTFLLSSVVVRAQQQTDLRKEVEAQNKKIADLKIQVLDLQKDHVQKKAAADEAIRRAEAITGEISETSRQLAQSPSDKKLTNELKKLERESKKADNTARKAGEELVEIETSITELRQTIEAETSKLTVVGNASASSENFGFNQTGTNPGAEGSTESDPAANYSDPGTTTDQPSNAAGADMIGKIVTETYKNYPQQTGQPNIIINNIIVPSDFTMEGKKADRGNRYPHDLSPEEIAEFREWRHQRYNYNPERHSRSGYDYDRERFDLEESDYRTSGQSKFRDRFAELPKRKSGLWVIPMVGLHASNFDVDFDNLEAQGRSGWNAGLDFRAHFNRFFIQPGAHYFSSSMELANSDSLSTTPFTSGPRIHSLRVPVLAGLYLTKAQGTFFKFNIKGGIVGNYILAVDGDDQTFTIDNLERYSYGINGGFGFELGFVTIDLSHEWGISRFFKESDSKNNMLRATIGFKL